MPDIQQPRQSPDSLTAHLASGGSLDTERVARFEHNLAELRDLEPGSAMLSLAELKHTYTRARVIHGGIVASRLALPTTIEAGQIIQDTPVLQEASPNVERALMQTETFLSGAENGVPRQSNDYPQAVKHGIAALAGLLEAPYGRAYKDLEDKHPDLLALGQDADELQRLCWGHMRWTIDKVVPAEEVALYRRKPLGQGTEELMAVVKERTGVSLPVRIMQRDDWPDALANPRQKPQVALFNTMKFFVENAEVALSYCIGSLLTRIILARSPDAVLEGHIRYGTHEIATGTRTFTHGARFQSRIGARPNDYRSFEEFLGNVGKQAAGTTLQPDGSIAWSTALPERGYCPAQNKFEPRNPSGLADFAERGRAAVDAWKNYGLAKFGVEPFFDRSTPGELLGAVVVFATAHENSLLRPGSELLQELAGRL